METRIIFVRKGGKHQPRHTPRNGGVGSRRQEPTDYVPVPGSPSLDVLRKIRRKRQARSSA